MGDLASLGALAAIGGAGMSLLGGAQAAAGAQAQGVAAQQAAAYQNNVDISQGKSDFAAAQRQMIEKKQEGDIIAGRQLALAAASGGGVQNPTIKDIYGQTAGRSDYISRTALYPGQQRQWAFNQEGQDALYRGNVANQAAGIQSQAAQMQGIGGALSGISKVNWGSFGSLPDFNWG